MNDKVLSDGSTRVEGLPLSDRLPQYAKPPVVEVAISVQFDELAQFKAVHFGSFWQRIADQFPKTQYHAPLASITELYGARGPKRASMRSESGMPVGRCWYLTPDEHRLIQVQPDRFILNWRKLDTAVTYPTYETLRKEFVNKLELFLSFVADHELGNFEPTQCELTYVNHLLAGEGWSTNDDLGRVLAPWSNQLTESFLPSIEDVHLLLHYRFEEGDQPLGRLHAQIQSAFRDDDQRPVLAFQLMGRGAPIGSGLEGVLAFTDRAHQWIVRGFTALTTHQMHATWERKQ